MKLLLGLALFLWTSIGEPYELWCYSLKTIDGGTVAGCYRLPAY